MSKRQKGATAQTVVTVLRSKELVPLITAFQGGIYHDMLDIVRVLVPFSPKEHPLYYCPEVVHGVVARLQLSRVPLLVQCLGYMRDVLFLYAAQYGSLDLLRLLESTYSLRQTPGFLVDLAAQGGHLDVLAYLHHNGPNVGCTTLAMDGAAMNGHLSIIEFLHNHRHEGCTPRAIVHAAENGHLDIVQFLHENVDEEWPIDAVAAAGMHGHVDIVRYLCEHGFLFRSDDDVIVEMALALGDHCPEAKDLLLLMLGGDSGDN